MPKTKAAKSSKSVSRFRSKRTMRLAPLVAAVALVVAVGGYILVRHASASAAFYHVCLMYQGNECLASHGPGNSVTIEQQPHQSIWQKIPNGTGFMFQNLAGNCLKAVGSIQVTVSSGACISSDASEKWIPEGTITIKYRTALSTTNPRYLGTVNWDKNAVTAENPANTSKYTSGTYYHSWFTLPVSSPSSTPKTPISG